MRHPPHKWDVHAARFQMLLQVAPLSMSGTHQGARAISNAATTHNPRLVPDQSPACYSNLDASHLGPASSTLSHTDDAYDPPPQRLLP